MRSFRTLFPTIVASFAMLTACTVGEPQDGDPKDPSKQDPGVSINFEGKFVSPSMDAALVPDQYIVMLDDKDMPAGSARADVEGFSQNLLASHGIDPDRIRYTFSEAISAFVLIMSYDEIVELAGDPSVKLIEQDQYVQASETWGLDRVDQQDLPLDDNPFTPNGAFEGTGQGTHIYVVDTGVRGTHDEFAGRIGNGFDAFENTEDNGAPEDCQGHGTHVAGTTAGTTYGLAKDATVHAVRVLDCNGSGTIASVVGGIDWVAANAVPGVSVANMSLGGGFSEALNNAVNNAVESGVPFVVAAGNENTRACTKSPASTPSAITVGSTTNSDSRSSFSNFGDCVDIFAPGSNITAAWHTSDSATNTISGTSMASPHVAGAVALFLANNPGATTGDVESALLGTAVEGRVSGPGAGSPNLLLNVGDGNVAPPPPPPPPPADGVLDNGVPATGLGGSRGDTQQFTMDVPAGASNLSFAINGGNGDADLYVRFGSAPGTGSGEYDCRPYLNGNTESCDFAAPQAGTYYVVVRAYSDFSGLSLEGKFDADGGSDCGPEEFILDNLAGGRQEELRYTLNVRDCIGSVNVNIAGGTGDADLYVKFGSEASTSNFDCRPYLWGNNETCSVPATQVGTYHITVRGYSPFTGVTLTATTAE